MSAHTSTILALPTTTIVTHLIRTPPSIARHGQYLLAPLGPRQGSILTSQARELVHGIPSIHVVFSLKRSKRINCTPSSANGLFFVNLVVFLLYILPHSCNTLLLRKLNSILAPKPTTILLQIVAVGRIPVSVSKMTQYCRRDQRQRVAVILLFFFFLF